MKFHHHRETFRHPAQLVYDRLSHAYDLLANASEHTSRERGLELLAATPGERALEIGFGTGHALVDLARAVGSAGRVVGLDFSPGMRRVAAARLTAEGLGDRVRLLLGDGRALPFADGSFDAIFLSFTLELFEVSEIPAVLRGIRRLLGPGGRLVVVAMANGHHHGVMVEIYRWMHHHFPHFVDCRPIELGALLGAADFRIESSDELSIWGLPVHAVRACAA